MTEPLSLTELYAAVPAAEEEDLLEQLRQERERAWQDELVAGWLGWPCAHPRLWSIWGDPADDEVDDAAPTEDPAEPEPPLPQLLGLLRDRLGATPLDDADSGVRLRGREQ